MPASPIVLGSRSPRRRELLSCLVPDERVVVLPPKDPDEPGFEGPQDLAAIANHLQHIARMKNTAVRSRPECPSDGWVLTADTVIVVGEPEGYRVLGQPPVGPDWRHVVRDWFQAYYFDKTHRAMTAVALSHPESPLVERIVETKVTMRSVSPEILDWYLETGEPVGKAGGYALQGAGSIFVTRVEGSLSNVVGLPLEAVCEMLLALNVA